jgi:hypothetical protein
MSFRLYTDYSWLTFKALQSSWLTNLKPITRSVKQPDRNYYFSAICHLRK